MKNEKYRRYIYWGVTAFVVLALLVGLAFVMANWSRVREGFKMLTGILSPIIWGGVFAYLMTPIFNRTRRAVLGFAGVPASGQDKPLTRGDRVWRGVSVAVATAVSLLVLVAVVTGLISMLIPELLNSIRTFIDGFPSSINNLQLWLEGLFVNHPDVEQQVMEHYGAAAEYLQNWLTNDLMPNISNIVTGLSSGLFSALNVLKNILIGLIVMVYFLNMKEKLMTQAKMVIYGAFPVRVANKVIEECRFVHHVFGGFIIGKILDSMIIGVMCFGLMSFANMHYVLLVSVIIGVTNVIPFFGPFIGAVPSAFLILLVDPIECLWFLLLVFLLQQFDGNILGPKILGDSTGISGFWVLFSILLFGGLFGFVGMIIGVPTFAVIYKLVTELVTYLLGRRRLSADIKEYEDLNYIDEEHKTYVKK